MTVLNKNIHLLYISTNEQISITKSRSSEQILFSFLATFIFCEEKMAPVERNIKSSRHSRSNSLHSAPHPILSQVEEHLHRLKDSEATTSLSSASSSSISHRLNDLKDLQESADKLLQLTISQQALAQECSSKQIEENFAPHN